MAGQMIIAQNLGEKWYFYRGQIFLFSALPAAKMF